LVNAWCLVCGIKTRDISVSLEINISPLILHSFIWRASHKFQLSP
jgi:hypothetical protein